MMSQSSLILQHALARLQNGPCATERLGELFLLFLSYLDRSGQTKMIPGARTQNDQFNMLVYLLLTWKGLSHPNAKGEVTEKLAQHEIRPTSVFLEFILFKTHN